MASDRAIGSQVQASARQAIRKEHFEIPDLRMLPTESLVLHEHADSKRVARLVARLQGDGLLKNPPIIAPIPGTDRYVVLDGANRVSALRSMGSPHVLAQVVDYKSDDVQLYTWYHLIVGRTPATFLDEIRRVEGITVLDAPLEVARAALADKQVLAYLVVPHERDGTGVYLLDGVPGTDHHGTETSTALLNATVDTYKGDPQVTIHRVSTDNLDELVEYYDHVSGLVVFPEYTPDDILKLATTGMVVPTGITRHIISPRALRVNMPIAILMSPDPLEHKTAWWHDQLKRKLAANEMRLYQEATYLFDE
ncbi:MAG TPA: ParB N-terminal domain-containing protein [Chloroflexia bacterium]